jgi:transposase
LIRVRKNASFKGGGCMPRKFAVVEQLGNADWRKMRGYGYRWMVESAFSSIKRVFGEYICAVKWPNIVRELLLKASIYNLFMKMNLN